MQISGKKIMVTGASGGLGHAMVRMLADRGAQLVLTARRASILASLAAQTGAEVVVADLTQPDDVDMLVARQSEMDVLVANAGVGGDKRLANVTGADVDFAIDVNLRAPIKMALEFAQSHLAAEQSGQIVLIGSLSGLAASPETRMYNATKFGLRGFALSLRQDLEATPVGLTHIAPGFIRDAGMFADGGPDLPSGVRTKQPIDVARAVVKAIESNPAEIFVSPIELKMSSKLATVAPNFAARVQRAVGASERAVRD